MGLQLYRYSANGGSLIMTAALGDPASLRTRVTASLGGAFGSNEERDVINNIGIQHLDSPSATEAIKYSISIGNTNWTTGNNSRIHINKSETDTDSSGFHRAMSSITILEIGG